MAGPLRVATTGAGYFSRFQYQAWARMPDVEVVAICNRTPEHAREIAEAHGIPNIYRDLDEMLDETRPDVLDVITPPPTHDSFCRAAIARGIPVICQKPFTRSLVEAEALVAHAEDQGGRIIIHENFRFQPWYEVIKGLLDAGRLGSVYEVRFQLRPGDGQGPDAYLARQPYFQEMERFLVHETAVHLLDVFRYLMGEIQSLYAELYRLNPVIAGEDAGVILCRFAGGGHGVFDGNRLSDHKARNHRLTMGEMRVEGSAGVLDLTGDGDLLFRAHGSDSVEPIAYQWSDRDFGGDCVYRFQRHVADHLLHGAPVMNTARAYLANLRLVEAAYESSATGRRIEMAPALV